MNNHKTYTQAQAKLAALVEQQKTVNAKLRSNAQAQQAAQQHFSEATEHAESLHGKVVRDIASDEEQAEADTLSGKLLAQAALEKLQGDERVCRDEVLGQPDDPPKEREGEDEERAALRMIGVVGLADSSNAFEEIALRSAVIFMAGKQAELMQAGIIPSGVLRLDDQDDRHARIVLWTIFKTDVALGWAQLQARYLLGQHWEHVEKIASVLKKRGMYEC